MCVYRILYISLCGHTVGFNFLMKIYLEKFTVLERVPLDDYHEIIMPIENVYIGIFGINITTCRPKGGRSIFRSVPEYFQKHVSREERKGRIAFMRERKRERERREKNDNSTPVIVRVGTSVRGMRTMLS